MGMYKCNKDEVFFTNGPLVSVLCKRSEESTCMVMMIFFRIRVVKECVDHQVRDTTVPGDYRYDTFTMNRSVMPSPERGNSFENLVPFAPKPQEPHILKIQTGANPKSTTKQLLPAHNSSALYESNLHTQVGDPLLSFSVNNHGSHSKEKDRQEPSSGNNNNYYSSSRK
jgi:hypothetical protein